VVGEDSRIIEALTMLVIGVMARITTQTAITERGVYCCKMQEFGVGC
jgi:hypothetical protein